MRKARDFQTSLSYRWLELDHAKEPQALAGLIDQHPKLAELVLQDLTGSPSLCVEAGRGAEGTSEGPEIAVAHCSGIFRNPEAYGSRGKLTPRPHAPPFHRFHRPDSSGRYRKTMRGAETSSRSWRSQEAGDLDPSTPCEGEGTKKYRIPDGIALTQSLRSKELRSYGIVIN